MHIAYLKLILPSTMMMILKYKLIKIAFPISHSHGQTPRTHISTGIFSFF